MLFNLLPVSITILLRFFFLFLIENVRPQLASTIPEGAPIRVANDAIELLLATTDETFNDLLKYSKEAIYLLRFLLIGSLSLISANK